MLNKIAVVLSFLFLSALTLPAFSQAAAAKEEVVATVGTKKITKTEFYQKFNDVKAKSVNPPSKSEFLEDLIRYEVGVQEAEKRNLEKDPIVQDMIKQSLYRALVEKEIGDRVQKITVSEKEMQEYYKKNPQIRFSHILIEVKMGATPEQKAEARKRAEEINTEVNGSKRPFEELVKLYSDDALSKQTGGDVGWQSRNTILPNIYEVLLKMNVGDVRGVIESQYGFHILKSTGRRSYDNANKRDIRVAVFDEKRRDIFNDFFAKLKKNYSIKENLDAIR